MKIDNIKILNFRSIKNTSFECSNFNIFVGQNNTGKTNFFEAIQWLFNGTPKSIDIEDLKYKSESSNTIEVEITFSNALQGAESMRNEANKTKIKNLLGTSDKVTIKRSSLEPKKRIVLIGDEIKDPGTGFDKALNDFLPKFEYISTRHYFEDVAKFSNKTPVGIMLSTVLEAILESNEKYIEFKQKFKSLFEDDDSEIKIKFDALGESVRLYLEKQFSDCESVKFEVTPPSFEDLLKKFETVVNDGVETYAHEKGDGMQRALMLAIIQAYADFRKNREDIGKSFLFFIDEAELHLHPTAQRKLKTVLLELCQNQDQVFLNTHSHFY